MKGTIVNYKGGKHTQVTNQMIITVEKVEDKEAAAKLVGKTVTYNTGKKNIKGEVRAAHGNSGAIRVLFETGMPGQAIGKAVTLS
ncbi:50S ribosomal protein L35ae [Candidatus Woesearchaeota archaeon]|nr:50S ribosomal protein L35ae [Candidatus Woesearchaeota archaeon]